MSNHSPDTPLSKSTINGLILAGRHSSRVGMDKKMIRYHDKPQQEYLFELLTSFCVNVFTSCKPDQRIEAALHPLPDQFELDSPLNGILSAFTVDATKAWLTVPVDLPMIGNDAIQFLLRHRDSKKIATCFFDLGGKNPEPLFALWEPQAFLLLHKFYKRGGNSLLQFLKQVPAHIIKSPTTSWLINCDTPDEVQEILRKLQVIKR